MAKKTDCPLSLHRNGQWTKRVKGKLRYFGTDKDAALKKWAEGRDYYLAGVEPSQNDARASVAELGNLFDANCRQRVEAGEVEQRTADEYRKSIWRLIEIVGRECRPSDLKPLDFAAIKAN